MAEESEDYYHILGIARHASDDDVKKAYRKAALRYHPDKNSDKTPKDKLYAEQKFKEAAEAFDVLSDPPKRKLYDYGGKEALQSDGAKEDVFFSEKDALAVFSGFFGDSDPFANFDAKFSAMNDGSDSFFNGGDFSDPFFDLAATHATAAKCAGDVFSTPPKKSESDGPRAARKSTASKTSGKKCRSVTVKEKTMLLPNGSKRTSRTATTKQRNSSGSKQ